MRDPQPQALNTKPVDTLPKRSPPIRARDPNGLQHVSTIYGLSTPQSGSFLVWKPRVDIEGVCGEAFLVVGCITALRLHAGGPKSLDLYPSKAP